MCWNLCVPCYSGCVCTWHVLRSVPRWTLFSSTFVIVGWIFSTTFLNESEEVLEEVNLQIVRNKYVHFSVNSIGVALICVDLVIAVTSSLLTGWTKEAFCLSLRTGSFEYKNGSAFQCGTCANILRISGWAILLFVALFAFLATVLATLGALVSFTYMVIASCGLGACQGGEEQDLPSFVTVMKANKFNVLSGNIDYETYCSNDHDKVSLFQIKLDVSLTWCFCMRQAKLLLHDSLGVLLGWSLILTGQVLLFAVMTDNVRIGRHEIQTRATNPLRSETSEDSTDT